MPPLKRPSNVGMSAAVFDKSSPFFPRRRLIRIGWAILSILTTSTIMGTGIGFVLGEVTATSWAGPEQPVFAKKAAFFGSAGGCLLGPIFY